MFARYRLKFLPLRSSRGQNRLQLKVIKVSKDWENVGQTEHRRCKSQSTRPTLIQFPRAAFLIRLWPDQVLLYWKEHSRKGCTEGYWYVAWIRHGEFYAKAISDSMTTSQWHECCHAFTCHLMDHSTWSVPGVYVPPPSGASAESDHSTTYWIVWIKFHPNQPFWDKEIALMDVACTLISIY